MVRSPASDARRLTLTYALPALLWVVLVDLVIEFLGLDEQLNAFFTVVVDAIFVLITAGLLYVFLRRELARLHQAQDSLAATNLQLSDRETRLRLLFQQSPIGIAVSKDGRLDYVNPAMVTMFGYPDMATMLAAPPAELIAPGSRDALAQIRLSTQPLTPRLELTALRRDKTPFEIEVNAKQVDLADGPSVMIFVSDISDRKLAESTLRASEERLQSTMDSMLEGGQIIGFDWRYLYVNDALVAQGRQPRQALIGRTLMEAYPGIESTELFATLQRCMTLRQPGRLENNFSFPDGSTGWFDLSIQPIKEGLFVLSHDITERKRAADQIERQLQRLAALRAIDQAITGSLDVGLTLAVFLEQVTRQLRVDAADVMLVSRTDQALHYAAGRGFQSVGFQQAAVRVGEGRAGRVVLERKVIVTHWRDEQRASKRTGLLDNDRFVSYVGAPLVAKGYVLGVLEIFHRSLLQPDPEWLSFLEALAGQAAIAVDNAQLFDGLQRSNTDLGLAYDATIEGWSRALDLRDKETEGHTQRVTELTEQLALSMGMGPEKLVHVRRGALLHDIGKMGIPDSILLKPGPLTDDEWVMMRRHPQFAYEMLEPIAYLRPALDIPYCHHEKWDGSGYPRGLKGELIPAAARMFAVVDVWDALTSDRPYRRAWPADKVREHIRDGSGTHFDPAVVQAFLEMQGP